MDLDRWRFESLRLTTFHGDVIDSKSVSPWELAFGDAPESTTINSDGRQEMKEIDGRLLLCQTAGNRVDWSFHSPAPIAGENDGLGPVQLAADLFLGQTLRWLEKMPSINRVALGGVAYIPVSSKKDGYVVLDELLPSVNLDVEDSSDFQYRINRPRTLQVGGRDFFINRISTWSLRRIDVTPLAMPHRASTLRVERASCELDVSSAGDNVTSIEAQESVNLVHRFVELAYEVLERGDIA